jgi:hypothetical protein
MTPGWHVTTGPAAILYHPASTGEGAYRASTEIHLFDPGDRREAYGLFVGGKDLEADHQSYLYFVLRNSGEFLVKRRAGAETHVVQDWTAHPAVVKYTAGAGASVKNALAVEVGDETVRFFVNGQEVASHPRAGLQTDGVVGLRVNHHLNLHVSDLKVEPAGG